MVSDILYGLAALALLLPGLAVGSRRLHDIGKSAWLMLLGLIPVIGWILLIYWAVQPGDPAANTTANRRRRPAPPRWCPASNKRAQQKAAPVSGFRSPGARNNMQRASQ